MMCEVKFGVGKTLNNSRRSVL